MTLYKIIYKVGASRLSKYIYGANPKQVRHVFDNYMQATGVDNYSIERMKAA